MMRIEAKRTRAERRAKRVRARIMGTKERPRLTVSRTLKHISAQLIDDTTGHTLASASDSKLTSKGKPVEVAREVGKALAAAAKAAGVNEAVFDRGSFRYHGRVAALADGAREGGLQF
jgi:large subunit ribosomal protein L18